MGACTSSIGTWMQKVAQSWLVLELTDSAKYLALDAFLGELPILLFTLIGGVVADRRDRRKLLLVSQVVQMSSAFTLAALVFAGRVHIWHVLMLSFTSGCAQAFGGPAYQSLVPSLVRKEHLPNAIALNSIQFNIARVLGPLLAGAALHSLGMVACFGLNGVLVPGRHRRAALVASATYATRGQPANVGRVAASGSKYVRDQKDVLTLTMLALASTFLGVPAADIPAGLRTQRLQRRCRSIQPDDGVVGHRRDCRRACRRLARALPPHAPRGAHDSTRSRRSDRGVCVEPHLWVSHVLLLFTGASMMIVFSLFTSLVQLIAPNEMRGRVMSAYMVAFRGGMPLGSLVTGVVVDQAGAPVAIAINGALLSLLAAWSLLRFRHLGDI